MKQAGMKTIEGGWRKARASALVLVVTLMTTPAFAGTSASTSRIAQKAEGTFQQFIDILQSPALTAFATIMFIMAVAGAYFGQVGDAFKGALKIAAITFAILSAASFMAQVVDAAGALI